MKKVQGDIGIRPFANDDWQTIQDELSTAVFSPWAGRGPFIVSGCQVSGNGPTYTVAPGLVMLDGEFRRFYGATDVTLPAQFQVGPVTVLDERPYKDAVTRPCILERSAVLVAANTAYTDGEYLPLVVAGGKRWEHVVQAATRIIGETQELVAPGAYVPTHYNNGVGLPGTEAWGWALCDGQGGRADFRGRVAVGLDLGRADYDAVGDTGGLERVRLQVGDLPAHTHARGEFSKLLRTNIGGSTVAGTDGTPGELQVTYGEDMQLIGGDDFHENRMPFGTVLKRQWVGF